MAGAGVWSGDGSRYPDPRAIIGAVVPSSELEGAAQSLERLCRAAVDHFGLLGAAVRLLPAGGSAGVIVAAEGPGHRLGDIEFDVGEGPGTTSYAVSRPVLVSRLAGPDGSDWPGFQAAAAERGVAAVFAFPLHLGAVAFGTLELFADRPGPLTRVQARLARAFAEIGVEVLLDGDATNADGSLSPGFSRVIEHRAEVAQAQGMVMVDLGISLGEAMARLRAHAFAHGLPLSDLARSVIDGLILPSDDGPTTGVEP